MIVRRQNRAQSATGQPQHSETAMVYGGAPRFRIGWSWYPGIRPQTVLMHNHTTMGDTNQEQIQLTPPIIPSFAVTASRSVGMGIRDNLARGYNVETRIVMPPALRR
jgi:hypothetical protein